MNHFDHVIGALLQPFLLPFRPDQVLGMTANCRMLCYTISEKVHLSKVKNQSYGIASVYPACFYGISKNLMTDINCKDGWTLQYEIVSCKIGI